MCCFLLILELLLDRNMSQLHSVLLTVAGNRCLVGNWWAAPRQEQLDSRIMDYIHGSSPFFANILKIMGESSGETCRFCNIFNDF